MFLLIANGGIARIIWGSRQRQPISVKRGFKFYGKLA